MPRATRRRSAPRSSHLYSSQNHPDRRENRAPASEPPPAPEKGSCSRSTALSAASLHSLQENSCPAPSDKRRCPRSSCSTSATPRYQETPANTPHPAWCLLRSPPADSHPHTAAVAASPHPLP